MLGWPAVIRRSISLYKLHAARLHPQKGDRVVVAMSGGVDSSVVARLLSQQDYDLSAVYMRNWDTRDESGTDSGCEWKKDWADVQRVCKLLDIPCKVIDLSRQYWTRVFEPALQMWEVGETPNPDIWCNREVKFGALLEQLTGKDYWLATGHYADKSWTPKPALLPYMLSHSPKEPRPQLLRPKDRTKDQTYYLSAIPETGLARAIFPLARFNKSEVRAMARRWGLPTAQREESMGICFVGEKRRFDDFISQYVPSRPGPILDLATGEEVGTHRGLWSYTIGQGARLKGMPEKMFVAKKDSHDNTIYVVPGSDNPALYRNSIKVSGWKWIWRNTPPKGVDEEDGFRCKVQFRHRMLDVPCTVRRDPGDQSLRIDFDEPQKAIATGQIAALWDGDWCLGCGTITETL